MPRPTLNHLPRTPSFSFAAAAPPPRMYLQQYSTAQHITLPATPRRIDRPDSELPIWRKRTAAAAVTKHYLSSSTAGAVGPRIVVEGRQSELFSTVRSHVRPRTGSANASGLSFPDVCARKRLRDEWWEPSIGRGGGGCPRPVGGCGFDAVVGPSSAFSLSFFLSFFFFALSCRRAKP